MMNSSDCSGCMAPRGQPCSSGCYWRERAEAAVKERMKHFYPCTECQTMTDIHTESCSIGQHIQKVMNNVPPASMNDFAMFDDKEADTDVSELLEENNEEARDTIPCTNANPNRAPDPNCGDCITDCQCYRFVAGK